MAPYEDAGCEILVLPEKDGHTDLQVLMERLGGMDIDSILLEGGSALNWSALDQGIVHKLQAYIAPKIFGGQKGLSPIGGTGVGMPYRLSSWTPQDYGPWQGYPIRKRGGSMFTGIIEETGILVSSACGPRSCVLNIRARAVLDGTGPGDSIAVNGVCLTAATVSPTGFTADVMPETMARTGLGAMKPGALVNLERAMAADGRFGGHIVSGHIDGTGTISMVKRDGNAIWYTVDTSPASWTSSLKKAPLPWMGSASPLPV